MQPKVLAAEAWAGWGVVGVGQRNPVEAANEIWTEGKSRMMHQCTNTACAGS